MGKSLDVRFGREWRDLVPLCYNGARLSAGTVMTKWKTRVHAGPTLDQCWFIANRSKFQLV